LRELGGGSRMQTQLIGDFNVLLLHDA
jgi:hypothetical protein